jgi:hypothetical protein
MLLSDESWRFDPRPPRPLPLGVRRFTLFSDKSWRFDLAAIPAQCALQMWWLSGPLCSKLTAANAVGGGREVA